MGKFITTDKVFSHLNRLKNYLDGKEVYPITVEIHPTNLCNNKCYYCIASRYRDNQSLTKEQMSTIIKKLNEMKVKGIIFSGGGEPFINEHTMWAIEFIKACGMEAAVITNGLGIKKDWVESIIHNCTWIRISLDSTKRNVYKKIRGVDGFDKVIGNIRGLVQEKKKQTSSCTVGTQIVVTPHNYKDIFETVAFVRDLGVDYCQIRPLENADAYHLGLIDEVYKQIKKAEGIQSCDFKVIDTNYKWMEVDPKHDVKKEYDKCHILPFNGAVDASGDIFLCCHLIGYGNFCYGNLIRDSVEEIFKKRKDIMKKVNIKQSYCPISCRGSNVNNCIESIYFKEKEHKNFL